MAFAVAWGLASPTTASAQIRLDDLVVTGGFSGQGYEGNLASVAVPLVDSTDQAQAAVGELGVMGSVFLLEQSNRTLWAGFDLGMRQFAASGFRVRDYAPREWAGRLDLSLSQRIADAGVLTVGAAVQGRAVDDRPPMPLYMQPGYRRVRGSAEFLTGQVQGVQFDLLAEVERSDYEAPRRITPVDLLDRNAVGGELGVRWGVGLDVRFYGGFRSTEYPRQASNDPDDPFRRDRTITVGGTWRWSSRVVATVGVEGIVNRSNSRRPEYDAFNLRTELGAPLPWEMVVTLYSQLTGKSYVNSSPSAVPVVPGEEADAASVVYLELSRRLAPNLDSSVRFGWTRAETDIGDSYYERRGVSVFLNYRPRIR